TLAPLACSDDGPTPGDDEVGDGDGDGDGDSGDGDGDGDPGDGDGDGDGDPGDGDGDGDGDPGDGDGDEDLLPPDFLDELTQAGGCGDVYIAAFTPAATVAIFFNGAELAETAHTLGETQVRESALPSADVSLRIVLGTDLHDGCNDVGDGPQVT